MQNCARRSLFGLRAGTIVGGAPLTSGTRGFALARSPKVRSRETERKFRPAKSLLGPEAQTPLGPEAHTYEWPIALIQAAHEAGGLPVHPRIAVLLLDKFRLMKLRGYPKPEIMQDLLNGAEAEPVVLTLLASILLRDHSQPALRGVAKHLLIIASQLHDEAGSLLLVEQALKTDGDLTHPNLRWAVKKLHEMVKEKDSAAMMLLARYHEIKGDRSTALKWAEAAVVASDDFEPGEDVRRVRLIAALEISARLKGKLRDGEGRREALERGAYELDDADAYYRLAVEHKANVGEQYIRYILKAAASGVGAAALEAGKWHFMKAEALWAALDAVPAAKPTPAEAAKDGSYTMEYTFAVEWFDIAMKSIDVPAQDLVADRETTALLLLAALVKKGELEDCHEFIRDHPLSPTVVRLRSWLDRYAPDTETQNKGLAVFLEREVATLLK